MADRAPLPRRHRTTQDGRNALTRQRVLRYLERNQCTQERLAELIDVTPAYVSAWLGGSRNGEGMRARLELFLANRGFERSTPTPDVDETETTPTPNGPTDDDDDDDTTSPPPSESNDDDDDQPQRGGELVFRAGPFLVVGDCMVREEMVVLLIVANCADADSKTPSWCVTLHMNDGTKLMSFIGSGKDVARAALAEYAALLLSE